MKIKKLPPGAVDFHTHILPGMDHGSRNVREAQAQWQLLSEAGVGACVATPHFYAHTVGGSVASYLEERNRAAEALMRAVDKTEGPRLYLGAEVLLFPGIHEMPGIASLCIEGTNLMLLEMPLGEWSREHISAVSQIAKMGICPLLAHIERYSVSSLFRLNERLPCLYQVNASSLLGRSRRARDLRRLAAEGGIAALGSDLHGASPFSYARAVNGYLCIGEAFCQITATSQKLLSEATPFF